MHLPNLNLLIESANEIISAAPPDLDGWTMQHAGVAYLSLSTLEEAPPVDEAVALNATGRQWPRQRHVPRRPRALPRRRDDPRHRSDRPGHHPAQTRRFGVAGGVRRVRRPGRRPPEGALVMTDLSCYGPDIEALADLAGDFDLRSPVDTRAWYRQTWTSIAEVLGFSQQLAAELDLRRGAREWVTATGEAGMAAFMVSSSMPWNRRRVTTLESSAP